MLIFRILTNTGIFRLNVGFILMKKPTIFQANPNINYEVIFQQTQ